MRRIVVLAVGLLVLQAMPALAGQPDVHLVAECSFVESEVGDVYLNLEDTGDKIKVHFVIHRPMHHLWRIVLRHGRAGPSPFNSGDGRVFVDVTKANAFLSSEVEVEQRVADLEGNDGFAARAVDQQTGQVCKTLGVIEE
jgi:hypothetical protein